MKRFSPFYAQIYRLVDLIPAGRVATYGQLAAILGRPRAARQVGQALSRTPPYLDLPAYRVVSQSGQLAPAFVFGGPARQKELLQREGVAFIKEKIDLDRSIWQPDLNRILPLLADEQE